MVDWRTLALYYSTLILPYHPAGYGEKDIQLQLILQTSWEGLQGILKNKDVLQGSNHRHILLDTHISPKHLSESFFSHVIKIYDMQEMKTLQSFYELIIRKCNKQQMAKQNIYPLYAFLRCLSKELIESRFNALTLRLSNTFTKNVLDILDLYYWLTRYIPPEHLVAAYLSTLPRQVAERLAGGQIRALEINSIDTPVDAHTHLTAIHPTLIARLQIASPILIPRYIHAIKKSTKQVLKELRETEVEKTKVIVKLSLIHAILRILIYFKIFRQIDLMCFRKKIKNLVDEILQTYSVPSLAILKNLYRAFLNELKEAYLHTSSVFAIDPLAMILHTNPIRAEHMIIQEAIRRAHLDKEMAQLLVFYIRLSSLLHRYLVLQPGYRSLEVFSLFYRRAEIMNPKVFEKLLLSTMQAVADYYSGVQVHAKASPRDKKMLRSIARNIDKDLFLFLSFIKKGDCYTSIPLCWKAIRRASQVLSAIESLLADKDVARLIIGIDIAGLEREEPNWVYKPFLDYLRASYIERPLSISIHAGEDYYNIFNGLRHIYEAVELMDLKQGDRIGHALALIANPQTGAVTAEPRDQLLFDLVFLIRMLEELDDTRAYPSLVSRAERLAQSLFEETITVAQLDELYQALYNPGQVLQALTLHSSMPGASKLAKYLYGLGFWPENISASIARLLARYLLDGSVIEHASKHIEVSNIIQITDPVIQGLAEQIKETLADLIVRREVIIESCPISNVAIRLQTGPSQHPLQLLISRNLEFCIGSDDPATLGTDIYLDQLVAKILLREKISEKKLREVFNEIVACKSWLAVYRFLQNTGRDEIKNR